jgi:hypothetical protein
MLVDDVPRYPMTFVVQLDFSGRINRQAFIESIGYALERHPLLQALIGPGKRNQDCWLNREDCLPMVDWGGINDPIEFLEGEYIDLRREAGLRMWIRHDDQHVVVTTQFHHCVCDGIGSYQFLGDILYGYAIRTSDDSLDPPIELSRDRLRDRGRASYCANNFRRSNGKFRPAWDEAIKLMSRRNTVLRPPAVKGADFKRPFPGIQSVEFDKQEYREWRLSAQRRGQTINDMLLEKLIETLFQWRCKSGYWFDARSVCVLMPLNLREKNEADISACNMVAHAFIRRTARQIRDVDSFRTGLGNEVLKVKHNRHKILFMHLLADTQQYYPRALKASLFVKRNMSTAILSNTGDPTRQFHVDFPRENGLIRCGNLTLDDLSGVPPMRPGTRATISIFTYRRFLKICMRCDPNQFSESDTHELLKLYVTNMRRGT